MLSCGYADGGGCVADEAAVDFDVGGVGGRGDLYLGFVGGRRDGRRNRRGGSGGGLRC